MRRHRRDAVFAVSEDMNQMYEEPQEGERWMEESLEEELEDEDNSGRGWSGEREQESCSYICILLV